MPRALEQEIQPWQPILPSDLVVISYSGTYPIDATHLAADLLAPLASTAVQGLAWPVATFRGTDISALDDFILFGVRLPLWDNLVAKDRNNLVDWSGELGDPMGDGSRRRALQFEVVLTGDPSLGSPPPNYTEIVAYAQFHGFGEPEGIVQTQDTPIVPPAAGPTDAFPNMILTPAFSAGSGHTLRVQVLVELPRTLAIGDWIDFALTVVPGANYAVYRGTSQIVMQIWGMKWRAIAQPFPFDPNAIVQLTVDDDGFDQSQPRLDERPYQP